MPIETEKGPGGVDASYGPRETMEDRAFDPLQQYGKGYKIGLDGPITGSGASGSPNEGDVLTFEGGEVKWVSRSEFVSSALGHTLLRTLVERTMLLCLSLLDRSPFLLTAWQLVTTQATITTLFRLIRMETPLLKRWSLLVGSLSVSRLTPSLVKPLLLETANQADIHVSPGPWVCSQPRKPETTKPPTSIVRKGVSHL